MVLIREVTAMCNLLLKVAEFSSQIRDGWYRGSAELDEFPTKVAILRRKYAQWTSLLEKFGEMDDEHFRPLVDEADQVLDKEQKYVRKMQSSCVLRSTRRAFPGQLTYILKNLEMSVDAGCKLLESRVDTHDLLERNLEQTPYPLPFGPDSKYVPLLSSITEVQKALEDANGRRVVTLHGRPGLGKSSLAKYLALHYQNAPKQHTVASSSRTQKWFPNRVFYLLCGPNARVNELQIDLLQCLRDVGGSSAAQANGSTSAPKLERELIHNEVIGRLRVRLAKQKVLIILDDVWETDVVENLLVPGQEVKYLVTSQIRSIWSDATKVELRNPDFAQARQIMANHTEGLPTTGKFPTDIESVTDAIIEELDYHPLSLANIGVTIDSDRATDAEGWKLVKRSLQDLLDENDLHYRPLVYQRSYPLTLDASMMLMVNSLPPGPQHLLLLIGLLDSLIPEVLVKTFLIFMQPTERRWGYQKCIKYLKDRSLVELHRSRVDGIFIDEVNTSRFDLATHSLRTYYIRKKHIPDMKSIATEILSGRSESNNHGGQLIQSGSTVATRALPAIMSAMYFAKPFKDLVVPALESQSIIFNGSVIPRSMSYEVDAQDLMSKVQDLRSSLASLVWLLNPDGESGWKRKAHDYVTKIVIKLVFQKKLDDESMAHLIQLPQTTTAVCQTLKLIFEFKGCYTGFPEAIHHVYVDQKITFSSRHWKTMESLLCLLHDNSATISRRAAAISLLGRVLDYESEDTILTVAKKYVKLLAKDSHPTLQTIVASTLFYNRYRGLSRANILIGEFPEVLDRLLSLVVEGKHSNVQNQAAWAIYHLCKSSTFVSRTMAIPGAVNILFKKFLSNFQDMCNSNDIHGGYWAGQVLCRLTYHPENRVRFMTNNDGLEGLTKMLDSLSKFSLDALGHSAKYNAVEYSGVVAEILGNLTLTNEVRKVILDTAPEVEDDLQLLQLWMISLRPPNAFWGSLFDALHSTSRALTIMDPMWAKGTIRVIPPYEFFEVYMGRVRGYMEMGMYSDALANFNILSAHECPHRRRCSVRMSAWSGYNRDPKTWWYEFYLDDVWRPNIHLSPPRLIGRFLKPLGIFLKAMLEDYLGAMIDANSAVEEFQDIKKRHPNTWSQDLHCFPHWMSLGERGVLKQMSRIDLKEALADLDEALADLNEGFVDFHYRWKFFGCPNPYKFQYGCLKHRGLVKDMMGDEVGARDDAKSALQLKLDPLLAIKEGLDTLGPRHLLDIPVKYLGFTL